MLEIDEASARQMLVYAGRAMGFHRLSCERAPMKQWLVLVLSTAALFFIATVIGCWRAPLHDGDAGFEIETGDGAL